MIVIATAITIFLLLVILLAVVLDIHLIVAFLIAGAVAGLGLYLFDKWASKDGPDEREVTIEYDVETNSAKLYKRVGDNLNGMKIQEYTKTTTVYNPSKTVYTSATVGGVTTGGFHQTQAYLSETSHGGAGKYYLWVKVPSKTEIFEHDYMILKKIILTEELTQEAQKDKRVKKFLQGNELVLKRSGGNTGLNSAEADVMKKSLKNNDVATQINITQRAGFAAALSWQECYDIKDWISGDVVKKEKKPAKKTGKKQEDKILTSTAAEQTKRKHPSYCVYREKKVFTCTCDQAKNYKQVCNSTAGCSYYKDNRD